MMMVLLSLIFEESLISVGRSPVHISDTNIADDESFGISRSCRRISPKVWDPEDVMESQPGM
jgi:hypothetical protein